MLYFILFIFSGLAYNDTKFLPVVFILFSIFFVRKFFELKKDGVDYATIMLIFMAYALPFSWRNVFGGDYGSFPLSWFHVFGLLYVFYILSLKSKVIPRRLMLIFSLSTVATVVSILPLIYSNSAFFEQALSQFVVMTFNNVIILFSIFKYNQLSTEKMGIIRDAYIKGAVFTSVMLICQFLLYKYANFEFGYITFLYNRILTCYLFTDISHGTLYLGTAAFWLLYTTKNKKSSTKEYFLILIISLGSAITSARTGLFILGGFIFVYILFGQKNVLKRIGLLFVFLIIAYLSFEFLQSVRQIDNVNELTNSSGRTHGYKMALIALKGSPWIGYGYSRNYIATMLGDTVPHLSILQYALHGGIFFALTLYYNQFLIFLDAVNKKSVFSWLLAMVLIGTCLIPDLFATRYITLLVVLSLAYKNESLDYS
ncbi:O-antigen ligase domain-containing protein [Latilactobacillus curvatus]|uniref:O-antigen ligase family protein n=1 Tax=Latilactobacillus curvatus TaxID=28038 RepID=UPI000976FED5|nr:O-antigen ligase family protein [Latilactobacillus curvatus]MCT1216012.1 O-antigen ligase domain-containing protein [Latilactobacillus curvatus]